MIAIDTNILVYAHPGSPLIWQGTTSAGEPHHGAGTLGAFLTDDTGATWLLSANHAIGQNSRCLRNRLVIPGIGTVADETICIPIRDFPAVNRADAAIARWAGPAFDAAIPGLPPLVADPVPPHELPGLTVVKAALPPRRATGRVAHTGKLVEVDLSPGLPYTFARFADQILIADGDTPFSRPGDSGSLVVHAGPGVTRPVGLLIANNADGVWSAVTPWTNLLEELEAKLGRRFRLAI